MANAFLCDLCGKLFPKQHEVPNQDVRITHDNGRSSRATVAISVSLFKISYSETPLDACPSCLKKHLQFAIDSIPATKEGNDTVIDPTRTR